MRQQGWEPRAEHGKAAAEGAAPMPPPPGGAAVSPAGLKHRGNGSFSLFWYRFTTLLLTQMGTGLELLIKKCSTSPWGCGAHCEFSGKTVKVLLWAADTSAFPPLQTFLQRGKCMQRLGLTSDDKSSDLSYSAEHFHNPFPLPLRYFSHLR